MANIEFEQVSNEFTSRRILGEETVPAMEKILTKSGIVRDGRQAKYILQFLIVILSSITLWLIYRNIHHPNAQSAPLMEDRFHHL